MKSEITTASKPPVTAVTPHQRVNPIVFANIAHFRRPSPLRLAGQRAQGHLVPLDVDDRVARGFRALRACLARRLLAAVQLLLGLL